MQNQRIKRAKGILAIILSICICFVYYLTSQMGIVRGANSTVDERRERLEKQKEKSQTVEGSIVDREGEYITVAEEAGEPAQIVMPEIYSYLVGYNSNIYGTSALRYKYSEYLYDGGKDNIGATIQLTTDNELQQLCYSLIGDNVGSIVILNHTTGEILAMASRASKEVEYNANLLDEKFTTYCSIDKFFYNRALLAEDPPGSTFKIVTAAALIEANQQNYTYNDKGEYRGIHNAGNAVYGQVDLQKALVKSVNTYFASAGNLLGGIAIESMAKNFMVGESIGLDFTVLTSNLDLDYYKVDAVGATSFGQGKTMISPLQIAMILGTVMNDGEMVKPYLIKNIVDDGNTIREGKEEILNRAISSKSAQTLKKYIHEVAVSYGFDETTYGNIYAKTGTVELDKSYYHIYLVFANESYTGIISMDCSNRASHSLVLQAEEIVKYLNLKESF